jgi:acetylornithine deacetylase/succinyl-diaminopimelate desuccinylase-like protein
MFNGHMDTSNTGRETFLTGLGYKAKAAIRKGMIYGLGIYNMKALWSATQAVKALMRAGVKLEGDVTIAAVGAKLRKHNGAMNLSARNSVDMVLARTTL